MKLFGHRLSLFYLLAYACLFLIYLYLSPSFRLCLNPFSCDTYTTMSNPSLHMDAGSPHSFDLSASANLSSCSPTLVCDLYVILCSSLLTGRLSSQRNSIRFICAVVVAVIKSKSSV
jgi:hypothetical protein